MKREKILISDVSTLVELLGQRAFSQPEQSAYTFLLNGESPEITLTYQELHRQARAIAARLQLHHAAGERALLLYPPGLEFVAAFFACLYAGVVAVPAYPPHRKRSMPRLKAILTDAQATVVLTTRDILAQVEGLLAFDPSLAALHWLATDEVDEGLAAGWQAPLLDRNSLAFLQYTSGSTGTPKGVMITHGNLLHNQQLIQQMFGHTEQTLFVGWLPLFHDMGLIGNVLQPLYLGIPCILMSPVAFLQKPVRWLQAISRYGQLDGGKAVTSGGPNFAYDLCVHKTTPEQRAKLDLSHWQIAFNGSEPVRAETIERFVATFASVGFRHEAFYPCYGLAEGTLLVSGGLQSALPIVKTVQASAVEENRVVEASEQEEGSRRLVGSGRSSVEQRLLIVNPERLTPCPPDQIGEIWISGESVAQGYWQQPEKTQAAFGNPHPLESPLPPTPSPNTGRGGVSQGSFFRTGDLGFVQDGELFVTGRLKDLIIIRGRNHYPQDIELTVERCHAALRLGCGAAFSVEVEGEERLMVAQEIKRTHLRKFSEPAQINQVVEAIRQAVSEAHQLQVYGVLLLKTGRIPKTSSGKIQRHACRAGFLADKLELVGSSLLELRPAEGQLADAGLAPKRQDSLIDSFIYKALMAVKEPIARQSLLTLYLQEQIARVLRLAPSAVNPQQPLTAFGLDSLTAIELKNEVESTLGIELSMTTLLQGPTMQELVSEFLAQLSRGGAESRGDALRSPSRLGNRKGLPLQAPFPLSYNQRALWFLHQLAPDSAAYNVFFAVRIQSESQIEVSRWQRAFQALVARHPSLRTTYIERDGQPVQQVHEQLAPEFEQVDGRGWSEQQVNEYLTDASHRPFDLEKGPLLRINFVSRAENDHFLLLTVHHIASDLWSLLLLMDELRVIEAGSTEGGTATHLAPHTFSYAQYVKWQREMLASPEGERLWTYWREQLAPQEAEELRIADCGLRNGRMEEWKNGRSGAQLPVLDFPTDQPRPPIQRYHGASHSFKLSQQLTDQLKELAQANGATLYMTLLAAFQVLLSRYTGQQDILVGSPMAGRSRAEFEPLVGHFVNTVVLRADLSAQPTFEQFLAQVRQTVLEALDHQDYPFQLLVERLDPERDASRSPIFQTMFALQKAPRVQAAAPFVLKEAGGKLDIGGLVLESWPLKQRVAQFDIELMMVEAQDGLLASLEYNTDLFPVAATIERMADHLQTLLASIVANPQKEVSRLPLLAEAERNQLLNEWNSSDTAFPLDQSFHHLFEQQVERTPDAVAAVAVVFKDKDKEKDKDKAQQLTYRELNARANQLADTLVEEGVGPETLVALLAERNLEFLIAIIAVFKAGGAYLPLNLRSPASRLRQVLEQSQVPLVLASHAFEKVLSDAVETLPAERQPQRLFIETLQNANGQGNREGLPLQNANGQGNREGLPLQNANGQGNREGLPLQNGGCPDLAYVIYTSGSTGSPKGVMIEQRGMVNHLYAKIEQLGLSAADRVAQTAPQSFDISVWQFLAALLVGGQVHIFSDEVAHDPARLLNEVAEQQISILEVVPSLLQMMLEEVPPTLSHLRWLIPTGEALSPHLCRQWLAFYPTIPMMNAYGPTECSDDVTHYVIHEPPGDEVLTMPIGRPVANMQLYILDAQLQPVPIGVAGELYVGGVGVGRGYLNDPERTAKAFIAVPKGRISIPPERAKDLPLYKTGDKARYLADGNIEFLGRLDHQVKIRGFRIELGEIEAVMSEHPDVLQAVVMVHEDETRDKRLVAYVVAHESDEPPQLSLRRYLASKLPDYMVPPSFVLLPRMPLTPNGKIDRRALPAPSLMLPKKEVVAPRTPVEERLLAIWRDVLRLSELQISIHDSFFELGGHSLLATKVVSRVRKAFQVELSLRKFFEALTVARVAEQIEMSRTIVEQLQLPTTAEAADREEIEL